MSFIGRKLLSLPSPTENVVLSFDNYYVELRSLGGQSLYYSPTVGVIRFSPD